MIYLSEDYLLFSPATFSSHLLFEVQELCNRVAILNKGQLVVEDSIENIGEGIQLKPKLIMRILGDPAIASQTLNNAGFDDFSIHGNQLTVTLEKTQKIKALHALDEAGIEIIDFRTEEPSLEDAFLGYIGTEASAGGVMVNKRGEV